MHITKGIHWYSRIALAVAIVAGGATFAAPKANAACALLPALVEPADTTVVLSAASTQNSPIYEIRSTDPVGPFPLSALVPFPWNSIDGVWAMKLPDGTAVYMSLEVQADCNGRRFLKVVNFDQKTFRVLSEGFGLALSNDTMVRAVMSSGSSQYMVYVRQYKLPVSSSKAPMLKTSTVVTVRPFNGSVSDDVHMIARKASTLTLDRYIERQRELKARREAERLVR